MNIDTYGGAPYIPLIDFSSTSGTVNENGTLNLTARLDATTTNTVSIPVTLSGTATNGTDYSIPTSISIAPGQLTGSIALTPVDDTLFEPNETVVVTMGTPHLENLGLPERFTQPLS